ncbi:MAG TPA: sigma-70 region 4 domain-containing protein, partial [Gemmatimonadales bacterium]|nr:sigma-70 region 4 domain-containing protein [Gemmatimonadales bacterium]
EQVEPVLSDPPGFTETDMARVRSLVRELPSRDREVLLLREFSELSYAEIADVVGRTVDAVKQDLFRARERLRQAWTQRYGDER